MSPYLPVTPEEIAESSIAAAKAGAAIIHLHARDPVTGKPDQRPEAFRPILGRIKGECDAVINLTTGGSPYMSVQERIRPATELRPELASMNMGSMGFGLFPMLDRFKEFKHDWERSYLEGSKDLVFRNTYGDIETALRERRPAARASSSSATTPRTYNLAHFIDRGLVKPPFVQTVFGILGGIGAHPDDVMHMKRTADRLFGDDYRWSVLGGPQSMKVAAMAASMGEMCVGLEDSLWIAQESWPSRTRNRCARSARS
jgi:uncharacterized protein (DUF849 family)